jgi:hypothetical protein
MGSEVVGILSEDGTGVGETVVLTL